MLCVTIKIEYSPRNRSIKSSILPVAIGSSAEQGSSSNKTSGSLAIALAMHNRCCCPPERLNPDSLSRSLTSSHNAAPRSDCSQTCIKMVLSRSPSILSG